MGHHLCAGRAKGVTADEGFEGVDDFWVQKDVEEDRSRSGPCPVEFTLMRGAIWGVGGLIGERSKVWSSDRLRGAGLGSAPRDRSIPWEALRHDS